MFCDNECSTTTGAAPQLFTAALNFFAASQCIISNNTHEPELDRDTFDFIVVGAGSAGSVVASRLSEVKEWNVLLLEAGLEPPIESKIPYMDYKLYETGYDWQYYTKPNEFTQQALKYGAVPWTRGKMLGGSSSINSMFYTRGRKSDFKAWLKGGNPSWTEERVDYYFKKAENFQDMELNQNPKIYKTYGHTGPLVVNTFNSTYRNITERVIESWDNMGIKKVPDLNSAKYRGYGISGISRVTAKNGERQSTYTTYLSMAKNRNNLKIVTNALVTKILINNDTQAYGVEVNVNGERRNFFANFEVITSAGSVNTPQLLMLSGIGPQEHLLSKNISIKVNLPGVGQNLQDHIYIFIPIYGDEPGYEDTAERMFDVVKYLYDKTGYLAQASVSDTTAFFSQRKNMPYPEFQSHHFVFWRNSSLINDILGLHFKDEVRDSITRFNSEKALYFFTFHLMHPFSRGNISLNSSNPHDYPIIEANYFDDDRDINATVAGIKILTKLLLTPYFKSINAFIPRVNVSQCNQYKFPSDLYWKCYAIQMTSTTCRSVGTTKMGPDPKNSVVDNYLKVHGVRKLRVIDAGIMPFITSGNTNAPTIMIGEMGADMIKVEYRSKT